MFREEEKDAYILKHNIDTAFISHVEQKNQEVRFQRIDADLTDDFKDEEGEDLTKETETLSEAFKKALNNEGLEVKVERLKNANVAAMVTLSEETRRMQDMMKMYGMDASMFGGETVTLVLNANHPLVEYVAEHKDDEYVPMICEQLYDLAMLSHKPLSPDAMTKFVARSNEILLLLTK
jgi:molecular chaperone HtpG